MAVYTNLIFDVDGTLAETEEYHRQAFNLAFEKVGLGWDWDHALYLDLLSVTGGKERIRHYAERADADFLQYQNVDQRIQSLHQLKTSYYAGIISSGDVVLRPGIGRLIDEALTNNLRLAISTTTTRENVLNLLKSTLGKKAPDLFAAISASDSAERKKPAPDVYFDVLAKLNCDAVDCVAFEDSQNGLVSAQDAGIDTVVTLSEFTSCDNHNDALAVVKDLGEIDKPCEVVSGDMFGRELVDLDLLQLWGAASGRTQDRLGDNQT
jgi:HAD superfamily hydrolase (TIGR01509 family)